MLTFCINPEAESRLTSKNIIPGGLNTGMGDSFSNLKIKSKTGDWCIARGQTLFCRPGAVVREDL